MSGDGWCGGREHDMFEAMKQEQDQECRVKASGFR